MDNNLSYSAAVQFFNEAIKRVTTGSLPSYTRFNQEYNKQLHAELGNEEVDTTAMLQVFSGFMLGIDFANALTQDLEEMSKNLGTEE